MKTFNEKVYDIVRIIPPGMVMNYGQIARLAGSSRASRAVGYAMNAVKDKTLPCHRVVFKDGSLAPDFIFGGAGAQKQMLKSEGVTFTKDNKINMRKHLCDSLEIEELIIAGLI